MIGFFRTLPVFVFLGLLIAACSLSAEQAMSPTPDPIEDLAAEFRVLRTIPGHFDGGTWNNEVDHPEGRKHKLMEQLRERFAVGSHTKTRLVELLGQPDVIYRSGDRLFDLIVESPTAVQRDTMLVYFWRGEHDFLYFDCREDAVLGAYWWMAGE